MIRIFRSEIVLKWSILITGLIFLNMNFFLAEVSLLEIDKDKNMVENIAKLIANASTEEEKDVFGGETAKDILEVDLVQDHSLSKGNFFLLPFQSVFQINDGAKPIVGNSETINPPPEA